MFTVSCPHCRHLYKLDDSLFGKRATCKYCRHVFVLTDAPETNKFHLHQNSQPQDTSFELQEPSPFEKSSLLPKPAEIKLVDARPNTAKSIPTKPVEAKKREPFTAESGLWNVGDVILGIYEVKPIAENVPYAEGGVGVVHRIYHREWDMDLAVKSPKPKIFQTEHGKKGYEQEAQTWIELGLHPNIVTCYLVRRIGGIPRLFAEFVPDGSLRDWIFDGRLYHGGPDAALLRILNIAIQFAWGLEHAHRQSLLHLDVKPANVMMSDQTAKVADFGLSQTAVGDGELDTNSYITIGMTPGYCSPEQFRIVELIKKQQFDQLPKLTVQTDIWSWAVSIFGMFFGTPPCNKSGGQHARSVFQQFLEQEPSETLPPIPETVAELLMQCFEEEPSNRPVSMEFIADELIKIYRGIAGAEFPRPKPVNAVWTPDSINNRAASMLDLGKLDEAEKLFHQAIALQPWHPAVTYNQAVLSWRMGHTTDIDIVERLQTLVKMRPKESGAAYGFGLIQRERGNFSVALESFHDALLMEDREDVRRAIAATRPQENDEVRCLDNFILADSPERKVYTDDQGDLVLFYGEPQKLFLHSTRTGKLCRTFSIPQSVSPRGSGKENHSVLSNDLLWELRKVQTGFTMWCVGSPSMQHTFQKISWGRRFSSENENNQVLLLDKTLMGDAVQNRVDISDLRTKHRYGSLLGHKDDVTAMTFSPDGRFILTAGNDRTMRLWELPSCRCVRTLITSKQTIDAVYLSPSGTFALSLTPGRVMSLWQLGVLCRSKPFRAPLQLSFVTSAEEVSRQQTEMEQLCNEIRQAVKQKDYAAALKWYEQAQTKTGWESARYVLEIEGVGDNIKRHTIKNSFDSALCTHTLSGHQDSITSMAVSLDANLIVSAGEYGEMRVWNIAEKKCIADLEGHQDTVRGIAMTSNAKHLVSASRDGSVRVWNIATGQTLRTFGERIISLTKIALNPQERLVAVGESSGSVLLWDVLENLTVSRFLCQNDGVNVIRFCRDGHHLIIGGNDGSVMMRRLGNDMPIHVFRDHTSPVTAAVLSTDGRRCFSADKSGKIVIRNIQNQQLEHVLDGHLTEISDIRLLADSRFLFSAAKDHSMKVWHLTNSHWANSPSAESIVSTSIEGNPTSVTAMELEISGRRLVTGGSDGVVRIWELLWNYQFPGWQPINTAAKMVLRTLMSQYSKGSEEREKEGNASGSYLSHLPKPTIDEAAVQRIVLEMDYRGFGVIPSKIIKNALYEILDDWKR